MAGPVVDTYMAYQFIKRLNTPFENWEAYKLGVIDATGKAQIRRSRLTTAQRNSWGRFDVLVANLKRLLGKIPGGKTKLAALAATVLLLREEQLDENNLELLQQHLEETMEQIREQELPSKNLLPENFRILHKTPQAPEGTGVPHKVDAWHQSRANGWCVQVLDKHDNQVGEAEYHYHKKDAMQAKKDLSKHHSLNEEIRGWKNAGRDINRARRNAANQAAPVIMVRLKKDGTESKLHDHTTYHTSVDAAKNRHENIKRSNPGKSFTHIIKTGSDNIVVEDAPANAVGGGAVAGIGVGAQGEPGMSKGKKKKKGELPTQNLFTRKLNGLG